MKVYVDAYLYGNLGDDLFVDILVNRYPNTSFKTISNFYKNSCSNIKIYDSMLMRKDFFRRNKKNKLISQSDITISIGGSMYIETVDRIKDTPLIPEQYYILGSNFGPYYSQEFYSFHKDLFKKAKDVCFRDYVSYNLFQELSNVRMAPDIVFSLDTSTIDVKNKKKVIISVIGNLKQFRDIYIKKIIEIMRFYKKNEFEICLMSFCKVQGDEDTINDIVKLIDFEVSTYLYNGNTKEALNQLASCQIIVGTRFHSIILGILFKKTIIPISYSEKTDNVLKDLNYKGKIISLNDIHDFSIDQLKNWESYIETDLDTVRENANSHFRELDKILR